MTGDRGIWKTGVLAVMATLLVAFVTFRAAEWSRSANGESAAHPPKDVLGVGAGGQPVIRIMPQVVAGSYDGGRTTYKTTIEIMNAGGAPISVGANFYNADGTPSIVVKTTNLPSVPTMTGTLESTVLDANRVLVINAENASTGTTGWARIVTSVGAVVSGRVELRDAATGGLHNRIGTASSPADMASFVIPWIRNAAAGLDTGFAIVNTGSSGASITGTVRDSSGTVLAAQTLLLPAGNHTATFAGQLFSSPGCSPCLTSEASPEASSPTYGSVTFNSTSAQFAAIGLSIEGAAVSTAPVERLR